MRVQNITDMIGNMPLLKIDDNIEYYAKIEGKRMPEHMKSNMLLWIKLRKLNE